MSIIALLHNKTTTYEDLNINKIKEIYEKYKQEIFKIKDYYYSLQDYFEEKIAAVAGIMSTFIFYQRRD